MLSSKKRKITLIIAGLVLLIIAAQIALPYVVLRYANKSLVSMKGYTSHVQDIDLALALSRGAYRVDSICLNKADTITGKLII
jgi:hypothetical protein